MTTDTVTQASAVADLRTEIGNKCTDFTSNDKSMNQFSATFSAAIYGAPGNMHTEIVNLEWNGALKEKHSNDRFCDLCS